MAYLLNEVITNAYNLEITDEVIGTGDGGTSYSLNSNDYPVRDFASATLKYTVSATEYTATCNSSGVFTGTHITSATINVDGDLSITTSTGIDNTTDIKLTYKTSGLGQAIINFCKGDDYIELIGTGNGSDVTFGFTAANGDIAKGQAVLEFWIGGGKFRVYDDGLGAFNHAHISSSSLNYTTKVFTVTFNIAIDDTKAVNLDYLVNQGGSGEGQDWRIILDQRTKNDSLTSPVDEFAASIHAREWILRNSGSSYNEEYYIGIREFYGSSSGEYGVNLNIYKGHDETQDQWNYNYTGAGGHGLTGYDSGTGRWENMPSAVFANGSNINLWVYTSKNRICANWFSNSKYQAFYVGAGRRLQPQNNIQFPMVAAGMSSSNKTIGSTGVENEGFPTPYTGSYTSNNFFCVGMDGVFAKAHTGAGYIRFSPTNHQRYASGSSVYRDTNDGKILVSPVHLFDVDAQSPLFELEGVFCMCTETVLAQDTLQDQDTNDYDCFIRGGESGTFGKYAMKRE